MRTSLGFGNSLTQENMFLSFAGSSLITDFVSWTGDGTADRQISSIDLSGGGVVIQSSNDGASSTSIIHVFDGAISHSQIYQSVSAANNYLEFNSLGFIVGSSSRTSSIVNTNKLGASYVAYVLKKDPKVCDVVFYTGTGASLGVSCDVIAPGAIIAFRTESGGSANMWHRGGTNQQYLQCGTTNAVQTSATIWDSSTPTATEFRVGNNTLTGTSAVGYCAVVFAHDTAVDGRIYCGSYTGNGTTSNDVTNLVWRPEALIIRGVAAGRYTIGLDQTRTPGFTGNDSRARMGPAGASWDASADLVSLDSATGFRIVTTASDYNVNASVYRYIAIRTGS